MTEVVYAISRRRKLLYIGRTNNFNRRRGEHLRNIEGGKGARRFRKTFRSVQVTELDFHIVYDGTAEQVRRKEKQLILKYRPPGNTEFLDPVHEKKKRYYALKKKNNPRPRCREERYGKHHHRKRPSN